MTERGGLRARLAGAHRSWDVLTLMVAAWGIVFGLLVWRRHARFGSFGFDMGIFDQAVWLAARGKSFITVRGLDLFGHHANVAVYLLAPFSWLGAGPQFLNLLQVAALSLSAVPLYLLARLRGLSPWIALVPAAAFLLHPTTGFLAWELFHPESVAIVFLLGAYLAAARHRWGWYVALLLLAAAWKEDVALAAFFLGLVVTAREDRRIGLWTMGASLLWFLFVNRVLLGAVNGQGAFYDEFFGDLGGSPPDIAWTALVHPTRVIEKFTDADALGYLWQMVASLGLVPLGAPLVVLLGVPQAVGNVLSVNSFTRDITFHYSALPLAALALAGVETLGRFADRRQVVTALATVMLAASLVGAVRWGVSPIGDAYDMGYWPRGPDPRLATKRAAVEMVPDGAPVSATYHFVPHLSRRERVYEFPNPFRERNWGVRGEGTHDPGTIEWVVVDRQTMGAEDRETFARAVEAGFEVVLDRDDIVVARRG